MFGLDTVLLDLATKIFKSIIDGVAFKQKGDEDLYKNFVIPILNNFEEVHLNYISTLQKYETLIKESESSIFDKNHPVIKEIVNDIIFSGHLRAKLFVLSPYHNDLIFGGLIVAIMKYFKTTPETESNRIDSRGANVARSDLITNIIGTSNTIRIDLSDNILKNTKLSNISDENQTKWEFEDGILNFEKRKEFKKEMAIMTIKILAREIQNNYMLVMDEFEELRFKLLRQK